jgi:hypothetical protein
MFAKVAVKIRGSAVRGIADAGHAAAFPRDELLRPEPDD